MTGRYFIDDDIEDGFWHSFRILQESNGNEDYERWDFIFETPGYFDDYDEEMNYLDLSSIYDLAKNHILFDSFSYDTDMDRFLLFIDGIQYDLVGYRYPQTDGDDLLDIIVKKYICNDEIGLCDGRTVGEYTISCV